MINDQDKLSKGTILQSRYQIVRVLGQGGFGITYEGLHIDLHKRIAIKEFFMRSACERKEGSTIVNITRGNRDLAGHFRAKFVKEARILAALEHPGIVRVFDIFEANDTAYYVMDYIDGESLGDLVSHRGVLPENEASRIICDVAEALGYIHAHNLLHLDVKPSNILIDRLSGRAILIDFGVAKQYDIMGDQTSQTPPAISKGYSPIEQYCQGEGIASFSPATDIYALAATYYKLLTGVKPPESGKLLLGEAVLEPYPPFVSKRSREAIRKCLRVRSERPQSINAFLDLLPSQETAWKEKKTIQTTIVFLWRRIRSRLARLRFPQLGKSVSLHRFGLAFLCVIILSLVFYIFGDDPNLNPVTSLNTGDTTVIIDDVNQAKTESPVRHKGTKKEPNFTYEGELLGDQMDGFGTANFTNGDTYTGYWKNNMYDGSGNYSFKNGERYVGVFKNGEINGSGTFYYLNKDVYTGQWQDGKKEGHGSYIWSDGKRYVGEFKNDKRNGQGTLFDADGSIIYKGLWADDKQVE